MKFIPNVKIAAALVAGLFFNASILSQADAVTITHGGNSVDIDFVDIGYAGNVGQTYTDNSGNTVTHGSVNYDYKIGRYEVTSDQWAAVSSFDANIETGTKADLFLGQLPSTNVSGTEAAKFANWLTSGDALQGAYLFSDATTLTGIDRNAALATYGTVYVLPTEDEWFKAAYYKSDGSGYTLYPTGDSEPVSNVDARYDMQGSDGPWKVGSGTIENNGTYDMGGNVWERTEIFTDIRGGRWLNSPYHFGVGTLASTYRLTPINPDGEGNAFGFRVVRLGAVNDRDGDGADDDEDLFPDDPKRATIIGHINCIIAYVSDDEVIFDSDWKNKRMRVAYINKLEVILELVTAAEAAEAAEDSELAALLYLQVAEKVDNDLIALTDGLQGIGARTRDDWILVQEAQDILYPDLLFLSDYLWLQVP